MQMPTTASHEANCTNELRLTMIVVVAPEKRVDGTLAAASGGLPI
jgi:hypothetical protein